MPNLLAIDCPPDFVLSMSKAENWSVIAGYERYWDIPKALRERLTEPPDPMTWNLVVDDSEKENFSDWSRIADAGIPLVLIPDDYIEECHRAQAIRLCNNSITTVAQWRLTSSSGHRTLEFNATSDARALHVIDFIEAFEADFRPGSLEREFPTAGDHLYTDVYEDPVVVLAEHDIECLVLLDIPDRERRSRALTFLCTRTAPKLWGDLYSSHFFPAKVVALKEQRDRLLVESRAELAALDKQIEDEQAKYAPYINLLYVGDDALKDLVAVAFRDVFGANVKDLDALTEEGDPKRLDLDVSLGGTTFCVEVRGRVNRNAQIDDIERFERNLELMANAAKYTAKLLVFNGMYLRDDAERARVPPFSPDVAEEAVAVKMGLLSTRKLLGLVEARLAGKLNDSDLVGRLSTAGIIA